MTSNLSFTGNLAADPVLRTGQSGLSRATFRVAVNSGDKDKGTEKTHWVGVTAFGTLAENVVASLKKGMTVNVVGRFDSYDKDVVIDGEPKTIQMLSVIANQAAPDLRWASAQVTKTSGGNGGQRAAAPAAAQVTAAAPAAADDDF